MMGAPLKGIGPPHATVHPTPAMPSLSMGASSRYGANSPLNRGGALPDVERHPPPVARSLVGLLALTGLKDALAEFDVPAGMDPDEEQYASWMVLWMPDARPPRVLIHQYVGRCFVEEEDLACALNESWVAAHPDRARMHPNWREVAARYRAEHPEECASSAWYHQRKLPTPASDPLRASDASSTSAAPHGAITAR